MRPDAIVVLDKPAGVTSHGVVAHMRRVLNTRKIGHAGTLDPMATGVLVLGVGRGTRLLGYLTKSEKEYRATIRLGQGTSTDDAQGDVTFQGDTSQLDDRMIHGALDRFRGEILQIPSSVSAIKVEGKRAHRIVRSGEQVHLTPRPVHITECFVHSITRVDGFFDVDISVTCSSGTYIRAIARDLGEALGVGGHLTSLRRVRSGAFSDMQELPHTPEDCRELSLGQAADMSFPTVRLSQAQAALVANGVRIASSGEQSGTLCALLEPNGELMALAQSDDGQWKYRAVFVGSS
jgi:tRNA pseudouridine55 synthase